MHLDHPVGLHEACRRLSPTHPDHAILPIQQAFNWSSCLTGVPFDQLYLVVFRSVRRSGANLDLLREHDDLAYADALEAGGLLCYFRGEMNGRRECLSFCLWESRQQAQRAAGGSSHTAAMRITAQFYESYTLERYYVVRPAFGQENVVFRRIEGG
jgi:hypothetical protein